MKALMITALIFSGILILPFVAISHTIDDYQNGANTYWGGVLNPGAQYPSHGDVIGGDSYDVEGIDVTFAGNMMTVKVVGNFFSSGTWSLYNVGDLYISSAGWQIPSSGSPHFPSDTFTNTEGWNYVVGNALCRFGTCSGEVYALDFNSITWTDPTYNSNGGRADQAWRGGYGNPIGTVTVSLDSSGMSFTFNDSFLSNPRNVGLHWAEFCGNDVIEGQGTPVPEPASILLVGLGLAGAGAYRRRSARTRAVNPK